MFVLICVYNLVPQIFNKFYLFKSSVREHYRKCDYLFVEVGNSVKFSFTSKNFGPSVWNSLPVSVRLAEHLPQFRID